MIDQKCCWGWTCSLHIFLKTKHSVTIYYTRVCGGPSYAGAFCQASSTSLLFLVCGGLYQSLFPLIWSSVVRYVGVWYCIVLMNWQFHYFDSFFCLKYILPEINTAPSHFWLLCFLIIFLSTSLCVYIYSVFHIESIWYLWVLMSFFKTNLILLSLTDFAFCKHLDFILCDFWCCYG